MQDIHRISLQVASCDLAVFQCLFHYGVSLGLEGIYAEALSRGVDIVLFGHTHRPVAEKRGNLWIVNPGSLTYPRQMGRKPSYAMLTINEEHELSVEIKYLD